MVLAYAFKAGAFLIGNTRSTSSACRLKSGPHLCVATLGSGRAAKNVVEPSVEPKKSKNHMFPWSEQWYAVALAVDVLTDAYHIELFSKFYVLQRTSENSPIQARVNSNKRGHRRSITNYVDSSDEESEPLVTEAHGVVWLWPGDASKADGSKVPLPNWLNDGRGSILLSVCRTVPCSFESLVENLVDAGHVNFAHHNAMRGWRRDSPVIKAGGGDILQPDDALGPPPEGSFDAMFPKTRVRFRPPGIVWHDERFRSGSTCFFTSPVNATTSRFILLFLSLRPPPMLKLVFSVYPRWLAHTQSHLVVDGDTVVLYGVERALGEHRNWKTMYGPPAGKFDLGVYRYRSWMDNQRMYMPGPTGELPKGPRIKLSRQEMLDRYHTHTLGCRDCSQALKRMRFLKIFTSVGIQILSYTLASIATVRLLAKPTPVSIFVMRWVSLMLGILALILFGLRRYALAGIEEVTYSERARRLFEKD